jgi:hypothetical protein
VSGTIDHKESRDPGPCIETEIQERLFPVVVVERNDVHLFHCRCHVWFLQDGSDRVAGSAPWGTELDDGCSSFAARGLNGGGELGDWGAIGVEIDLDPMNDGICGRILGGGILALGHGQGGDGKQTDGDELGGNTTGVCTRCGRTGIK